MQTVKRKLFTQGAEITTLQVLFTAGTDYYNKTNKYTKAQSALWVWAPACTTGRMCARVFMAKSCEGHKIRARHKILQVLLYVPCACAPI